MSKPISPLSPAAKTRKLRLERSFAAPLEDVWEAWTTAAGIESWWGPDGFQVTVSKLELHAGGELLYTMTAVAPETVAYMKSANMPVSTPLRIRIVDVRAPHRLEYVHLVDFVPGTDAYDVHYLLELEATAEGTRLTLSFDAMHAEEWTQRAVMGWENELGKLARVLER